MQPLLARKKMELSSLRSQWSRERRLRSLPLGKCTSVKFQHASRREMSSIRTIQHLGSSVRSTKMITIKYSVQSLLALISWSEHRTLKNTDAFHLRVGQ
jgi:hypothetical protein